MSFICCTLINTTLQGGFLSWPVLSFFPLQGRRDESHDSVRAYVGSETGTREPETASGGRMEASEPVVLNSRWKVGRC